MLFHLLNYYGALKVAGPDAKKLLQGQLTCHLETLAEGKSCMGAHCNPQGRIISLFYLSFLHDGYYLFMPRNMIPIALAALKKYAVFYKTELNDVSDTLEYLGHQGPIDQEAADKYLTVITLPTNHPRQILISRAAAKSLHPDATAAWKRLDIQEGIPQIYPNTSGKFLPHEINLDKLKAISFDKGCYTGQEIIARMHYRGKLKNHLYRATLSSETPPEPGSDIYSMQDQTLKTSGIIVDTCHGDNNQYHVLIVTEESNAKNHHLFLKDDDHACFTIEE